MKAGAQGPLSPRAATAPSRELELNEILRILNSKLAGVPMVASFELAPMRDDAHHRQSTPKLGPFPGTGPLESSSGTR